MAAHPFAEEESFQMLHWSLQVEEEAGFQIVAVEIDWSLAVGHVERNLLRMSKDVQRHSPV